MHLFWWLADAVTRSTYRPNLKNKNLEMRHAAMATPHSDKSCEAILTDVASCLRHWPPGALGIPSRLLTTLY